MCYRIFSSGATALQGFGRQSGRRRSAKLVPTFADRGVSRGQCNGSPRPLISVYRTWIATYFIQVAPLLTSRGWVHPVPDPLPLRKSGSAGNWTRDLCICSQKPWPLDHRGGLQHDYASYCTPTYETQAPAHMHPSTNRPDKQRGSKVTAELWLLRMDRVCHP